MKVLLIKDVYKLGRAGEVKKVAAGYGRNYLLPQSWPCLPQPGALKQADKIRSQAEIRRTELNSELKDLAGHINGVTLIFRRQGGRNWQTVWLDYHKDVAMAIQEKTRYEVKKQQIDMQPIRNLGEFTAHVRLTMDLVPEVKIIVHREGEAIEESAHCRLTKRAEAPAQTAETAEA